jgi:hypothetical protein
MAPNEQPDDQAIAQEDRRESAYDRFALVALVAALCVGFVLLVAIGYGVRALIRSFS